MTTTTLTPTAQKLIAVLSRERRSEVDLTTDGPMLRRITARPRWLLSEMHRRGLAHPVQYGRYLVNLDGAASEGAPLYELDPVAALLLRRLGQPYYLSWHSALWHHGLLEQQSNRLRVAVTFRKRDAHFENFDVQFVTVRPRKFFGWVEVDSARAPAFLGHPDTRPTKIAVATVEKAFVDAFDRPDLTAPMAIIAESLRSAWRRERLDPARLVEAAITFGSPWVNRRLGFFMAEWGIPGAEQLHLRTGRGPAIPIEPGGAERGVVDRHWRVYADPFVVETARARR